MRGQFAGRHQLLLLGHAGVEDAAGAELGRWTLRQNARQDTRRPICATGAGDGPCGQSGPNVFPAIHAILVSG